MAVCGYFFIAYFAFIQYGKGRGPKINWKNHFIELLVVIIGISIAFSLNNWKESSKDKKPEKRYLQNLLSGLERYTKQLTRLRDTSAYVLKMNKGFLNDNFFRNRSYSAYYF